jgi:peptidoglycan/LPS O-acetylase OafA/YrhL
MIFNSWEWHIKNDMTYGYQSALWYIMTFLSAWRMPLLIFISGAGTFFALRRRSTRQYLSERFKRLFIPLIFGIFVLVPLQVYLEKAGEYDTLLDFYPEMFDGGGYPAGNFSWHHLWFIAYLFFIALVISPFLGFLRGKQLKAFTSRLMPIASKKLGTNIVLIPVLLSQLLLRPYFPENTNALYNDWAALVYYLILFLAGYFIISTPQIAEAIRNQRRYFLMETITAVAAMFILPGLVSYEELGILIKYLTESIVAWSCGMTALGYAGQYINKDSRFRKLANEAIYPFYLLHQPVIVIAAYYIVEWELTMIWKALLIAILSFLFTILIYWYLVRPWNLMRRLFGMKTKSARTASLNRSFCSSFHLIEQSGQPSEKSKFYPG